MYIVEKPYEIVCIQLKYLIEAKIEICFGTDFLWKCFYNNIWKIYVIPGIGCQMNVF